MNKIAMISAAALLSLGNSAALAEHAYIGLDENENMVLSGPFNAIIPKPEGARVGAPKHTNPSFLDENLKVSKAGYFTDDQLVMVQIETTSAGPGALTNENMPVYALAGEEFRARTGCISISQEELNRDDDSLFEFIEDQNVQIVPAVKTVQLSVINDDGSGEGKILYMRNVPGGCDSLTPEFESDFEDAFERFIESIRGAN